MQTQPTETSALDRYLAAELDYFVANFSDISPRLRRTLRRIAALSLLALSANRQTPAQTPAGMALDKLLAALQNEWPEITLKQLVAFTEWFAGVFEQFNISEELTAPLLGF